LAQPPELSETFVREVDENLRRDQLRDFFKAYANWMIAGVVIFLAASGGFIWWQQHQVKRSEGQVEQLAQIYKDVGNGQTSTASPQLDQLAKSGSTGVRASAMFARAALALQDNDTKSAVGIYRSIASDDDFPKPYRDAALVRQTAIEFDQLQPQDVISRLAPLTKAGEPWFGSAGELTALAMIKQGKKQDAGQLFAAMARDAAVPETIRARAAQVAGSLGIDVGATAQPQAQ
jgi:hypothetical protein